jgi:hypothetical protein
MRHDRGKPGLIWMEDPLDVETVEAPGACPPTIRSTSPRRTSAPGAATCMLDENPDPVAG